ncbi:MAG TPA: hypothetical protein VMV44_12425 [Rectinemataceae bacterium]|nr:hypothetical protein [Rectinemataceae bacterium]
MKAWFAALAKLLVELLMLLLLLASARAFAETIADPGLGAFASAAMGEALRVWPIALALTLTTGVVSFAGLGQRSFAILLSVALLGLVVAMAGTWAREGNHDSPQVAAPRPLVGQLVEDGDRLASVSAISGDSVRGLVTLDWALPMPRLGWNSRAPFDAADSQTMAGGKDWNLAPRREKAASPISTGLPLIDSLREPLHVAGEPAAPLAYARALGFVLLCVGLGALALRPKLPMNALIIAILAGLAALLGDSLASSTSFLDRGDSFLLGLGRNLGLELGGGWVLPLAEGLVGLVGALFGLLLARGKRL